MSLNYRMIAIAEFDILYEEEAIACYVLRQDLPGELYCTTGLSQDVAPSR
jgi:hypothetical protein